MADDKAKLEIDVASTLKQAKADFERFAKETEDLFAKRKSALSKGGRSGLSFLVSDEEYKKSVANTENAKHHLLKSQADFERKTTPMLKRAGGALWRWAFGEKVGDSASAESETKKIDRHMTAFQRRIHGTLAISQAISSTLTPLPGGGVLHAGLAGMVSGFSEGTIDQNTGERKKGLGGFASGIVGGVKAAGIAGGLVLLAKAIGGAVSGGREDENIGFRLSQAAGGDVGLGRRGRHAAHGQAGMLGGEAMPTIAGVFKAGGGEEGARSALRAQLTAGLGGEFTNLLGSLAQSQGGGTQQVDANAKKLWIDVLATGVATGIQKGRIGELIVGAQRVAGSQALGTNAGDPSQIFKMFSFLGKSDAFQGTRGAEMTMGLDRFSKGDTSPVARALSLMQSGLGKGKGFVESMRVSERGLFGQGGANDDSVERVKGMVKQVLGMAGGNRDIGSLLMSQIGGMGINASTELIDLVNGNKFGKGDFERFRSDADVSEKEAYKAMIQAAGAWKGIDKQLEGINTELGHIFQSLGGTEGIAGILKETRDILRGISHTITDVKKVGLVNFLAGVKPEDQEALKQMGEKAKGNTLQDLREFQRLDEEMRSTYAKPGKESDKRSKLDMLNLERESMREQLRMDFEQMTRMKVEVDVTVRDEIGQVLERKNQKQNAQSGPPQRRE